MPCHTALGRDSLSPSEAVLQSHWELVSGTQSELYSTLHTSSVLGVGKKKNENISHFIRIAVHFHVYI